MLDSAHKLTRADEYRRVVRRGRRSVGAATVSHILMNPNGVHARFGFIVAKTVGNAVTRNRVRRRLKAICFELRELAPSDSEIVVRAQPAAAGATFQELRTDLRSAVGRATSLGRDA